MEAFRSRLDRISSARMTLVGILFLCLLLRLGMSVRESKKPLTGDALTYTKIALHIARGDGFRTGPIERPDEHRITAFGNPIYPVFLAGIYRVFGLNVLAVLVIQSLLDTLTCLIVFWLTLKVARSRSAATVAAFLYTIYPPFIYSAAWPYTETLTALLLTPAAYLYWISLKGRARLAAGAGALMGIIMLLRPAMLFFAPFVFVGYWLNRQEDRAWLGKGILYVAMCYLVVSPWTFRNYLVYKTFVPVSTHGGMAFYAGTGPADGGAMPNGGGPIAVRGAKEPVSPDTFLVSQQTYDKMIALRGQLEGKNEAERDDIFRKAGMQEIKQHPGRYAFQAVKKFFRLWFNVLYDEPQRQPPLTETLRTFVRPRPLVNLVLLMLGVLGALMSTVDRRFTQFVLLLCVNTTLVCMAIYSVSRYSWPAFVFIVMLAGAFVAGRPTKPGKVTPVG